jgi:hypothetical protein
LFLAWKLGGIGKAYFARWIRKVGDNTAGKVEMRDGGVPGIPDRGEARAHVDDVVL